MNKDSFDRFKWINESKAEFSQDTLIIEAPAKSVFFLNNGVVSDSGVLPTKI